MSTAKFEKLIDLIINEDQEAAEKLFHEIVVSKSREIYESLMDEDMVGDMADDIAAEEQGFMEDEFGDEDMEMGSEEEFGDEEMGSEEEFGDEEMGSEEEFGDEEMEMGSEEPATKDDIMNLEDKLDQILAQFDAEQSEEVGGEEEDFGGEEEAGEEEAGEEEAEDEVMESVQLSQVGGKTYDKFGKMGDDGVQTKSPVANKGQMGMAGKPVNFAGKAESVPTSPKADTGYLKRGSDLQTGAKNSVNGAGKLGQGKGEAAPKPKSEDPGKSKSPVAESKKTVKKIVK
jgi:hypothetical protein